MQPAGLLVPTQTRQVKGQTAEAYGHIGMDADPAVIEPLGISTAPQMRPST